MLIKTHLMVSLLLALLLLPFVEYKLIFLVFVFVATYIPDVDSRFSSMGHKKVARVLQFFTKHRGVIHSFTFLLVITLILVLFFPIVSLGFFVGYSSHLLADSFTIDGIRPFYPLKNISRGGIATGGVFEKTLFISLFLINLVLISVWLVSIF
ncbi:metal-dependent hydrolase [archaeon]|jgi:inner membrane protein|nr:metal-dependent hydrolase [archaeon]MBT4373843.1 metal-dependent hydrolase [archaeon]MBT4532365.1 metal-dependent hydrolase [archaeon]MBT7001746.1 metal-dependent hydrolase [archaeon]MBT7281929.1 metal-dependent hydrolase [archaeon]